MGVKADNGAGLRLIMKATLLHRPETGDIEKEAPQELYFRWRLDV